jgi:hypothetical protein
LIPETPASALHISDMRDFQLNRLYKVIMIPFNSFVHCLTTDEQVCTLSNCYRHLENGGILVFDTFFPGLGVIGGQENVPVLELEEDNPETGLSIRMYDTRSFNRVQQIQSSKTGDLVRAVVPSGKKKGRYHGRIAIRATGNFNIRIDSGVVEGIQAKYCRISQQTDGYSYTHLKNEEIGVMLNCV